MQAEGDKCGVRRRQGFQPAINCNTSRGEAGEERDQEEIGAMNVSSLHV